MCPKLSAMSLIHKLIADSEHRLNVIKFLVLQLVSREMLDTLLNLIVIMRKVVESWSLEVFRNHVNVALR